MKFARDAAQASLLLQTSPAFKAFSAILKMFQMAVAQNAEQGTF